jgi:hypothetical protein
VCHLQKSYGVEWAALEHIKKKDYGDVYNAVEGLRNTRRNFRIGVVTT